MRQRNHRRPNLGHLAGTAPQLGRIDPHWKAVDRFGRARPPWYVAGVVMDQSAQALIAKLRIDPADGAAYEALKAVYHRKREFASLANLIEGWAKRSQEQSAAAECFSEVAHIALTCLNDSDRAISLYRRALQREGLCESAWRGLQFVYEQRRDFRRLYEVLEQHESVASHGGVPAAERAKLHQKLGVLAHNSLQRTDVAMHHYQTAAQLDPHAVAPVFALRELHYTAGNFAEVAELYAHEARLETDPQRRHSLWVELSNLRLHRLGDILGAIEALRTARSQAPRNTQTLHSLASLLIQQSELEQDKVRRTALRGEAAEALYELAQQVGGEHVVTYCEAALDAAPAHEAALARLEQALSVDHAARLQPRWAAYIKASQNRDGVRRRRLLLGASYRDANQLKECADSLGPLLEDGDPGAAEALVDVYASLGRPQDVVLALDVWIGAQTGPAPASLLRSLLNALIQIGAEDRAFATARTLLDSDPNDGKALSYLTHICRARSEFRLLADSLQRAVNSSQTPVDEKVGYLQRLAKLFRNQLDDDSGILSAFKQIMQLRPTSDEAASAYGQLLEERSMWDELATVLKRRTQLQSDPAQELLLLRQLATVQHTQRKDSPEAIEALRQIHDRAPNEEEVRDLLCELLLEVGAALEATPLMRQRIQETKDSEERVTLIRRLAQTLTDEVGDEEGAYELYAELLDAGEPAEPILEAMILIDQRLEEWERLLNTLSYRAELATTEERAEWILRMANIALVELADSQRASALLDQALDISPGHSGALDALTKLHVDANTLRELVKVLKRRASDESLLTWRPEYYRRIARALAKHVGNADAAEEAWHKVLADQEDEEALRFLRSRADQRMTLPDLVEYNGRLAVLVSEPQEARDLLVERALVLRDAMNQPADALSQLSSLADGMDGVDAEVWDALADTHFELKEYAPAALRLRKRLEEAPKQGDAAAAAARLAEISEEHLDDSENLIFALRAWCTAEPTHRDARRRLANQLITVSDFEAAVVELDRIAELELDDDSRQSTRLKAAQLVLNELRNEEDAWVRLTDLVRENAEGAESVLRAHATASNKAEQLTEFFIDVARTLTDPETQHQRWLDIASIYEAELGDPSRALEAALRALAADLDNSNTLAEVERLAIATEAWPRIAQVYQKLITQAENEIEQGGYLLRHARLLDEHGQSTEAALDLAIRGWMLDPSLGDQLHFVERLSEEVGTPHKAIGVFERALTLCQNDPKESVRILLRGLHAEVTATSATQPPTDFLGRAIDASDIREPLLRYIEGEVTSLHESQGGSFSPSLLHSLADLLLRRAEGEHEEAGSALFIRAAHLLADPANDHKTALDVWKAATTLWPDNDDLLDEMESYTESRGRLDDLVQHLERLVDETVESSVAVRLLDRWGRILESGLEDYVGAIEVYQRLLTLTPDDTELTRRLRRCLEQQGRHQEVLGILRHELDRRTLPRERKQLLREIAMLWEHDLSNRWEALDAWRALLAEDPENEEANEALIRLDRTSSPGTHESPSLDGLLDSETEDRVSLSVKQTAELDESYTEFNGISSEIFEAEQTDIPKLPEADLFADSTGVSPSDDTVLRENLPRAPLAESYTEITPGEDSSIGAIAIPFLPSDEGSTSFMFEDEDDEEDAHGDFEATRDELGPRARSPMVATVIPEMQSKRPDSEIIDLGSDLFSLEESLDGLGLTLDESDSSERSLDEPTAAGMEDPQTE